MEIIIIAVVVQLLILNPMNSGEMERGSLGTVGLYDNQIGWPGSS